MRGLPGFLVCLGLGAVAACGSSNSGPIATNSGVVAGPDDAHCTGTTPPAVGSLTCSTSDSNATSDPNDTGDGSDYGATMDNSSGNDDDCKYHVVWSADNVEENQDVAFTVKATWLADGSPLVGAYTRAEVFLSDTHVAPNSGTKTTENPNGTYTIKPVRFDQKGQWTVRFHFFENCVDADDSPHGHAAFYVNVP